MSETRPLSAREAAAALGVSDRTIRRAILDGKLVATKAGRSFLIDPLSLERFRASQCDAGAPEEDRAPASPPVLIGRERDLVVVLERLRLPETRLLTITGAGGVGKTVLARAAAAMLEADMPQSSLFLPLAAVSDPGDVPGLLAEAAHLFIGQRAQDDAIDAWLDGTSRLIVFDNFEHVRAAAGWVERLLERHPGVVALVTSREALALPIETAYTLEPLALPSEDVQTVDLRSAAPSVRLFVQHARDVSPDFGTSMPELTAAVEIVRRLDGLPLAIELAAARMGAIEGNPPWEGAFAAPTVLPLDHDPDAARQRTLFEMLAWSYDLLNPEDQRIFQWLALLPAGASLAMTYLIADPTMDSAAAFRQELEAGEEQVDVFDRLARKHLIVRGVDGRWSMLETTRAFALSRLDDVDGREVATRRIGDAFEALAATFWIEEMSARQRVWLARLGEETGNLRAVLRWAEDQHDGARMVRIAGWTSMFWRNRGMVGDAVGWLERGLALLPVDALSDRSLGLAAAGYLHRDRGESERARAELRESLDLLVAEPDLRVEVLAREQLIDELIFNGGQDEAVAHARLLLSHAREDKNQALEGVATYLLGMATAMGGDLDEGRRLIGVALELCAGLSINRRMIRLHNDLGTLHRRAGDSDQAATHYQAALEIARLVDARDTIAILSVNLADLALHREVFQEAISLATEAVETSRELGMPRAEASGRLNLALARFSVGEHNAAFEEFDRTLPTLIAIGRMGLLAEALETYGQLLVRAQRYVPAAIAFGAARTVLRAAGPISMAERNDDTRTAIAAARRAISPDEFDRSWRVGETSPLNDVLWRLRMSTVALRDAEPDSTESVLSVRERQVLGLVAEGLTDREIGDVLFLSPRTVASHVARILDKLGVETRTAAATLAVRRGYIT